MASDTEHVLEAHRQALAALALERDALAALQTSLARFAEQALQMQRENTAVLSAMRSELDRMVRRLKQLATAGA
ncbi:MAG: hypothetical protein GXY85_03300 [Candidatus Brocadiaceae bacterium]|nr:hypothetical protein [Candidatus Brocadiaceae bacterium]